MLGTGEILLILFIVLLVFGASRLPMLGDSLGKALKNFKRAANTPPHEIDVTPKEYSVLPPQEKSQEPVTK